MGPERPERSARPADAFFESMWEAAAPATVVHTIRLAGHTVDLCFSSALEPRLMPALAHLTTEPGKRVDLQVRLWDSDSTGVPLPATPWSFDDYPDGGEIRGPDTDIISIAYRFDPGALSLLDRASGRAVFWIDAGSSVPGWMSAAPLRTILPWFIATTGGQFVHGAGVGLGGGGILIAGAGGSGKSTTALLCATAGLEYLGDDYVIVGADDALHSAYGSGKLDDDSLRLMPQLEEWIVNDDPELSKHVVMMSRAFPDRVVPQLTLHAVVLPHVTDSDRSRFRPASASDSLLALAPTTMFQLPGAGRPALRFMADIARGVPTFHLDLGPPEGVAESVSEFLRSGGPA